ncbi:MAG: hypothetical protein Q4E13_05595 [Clostridia bacterium]|nr:hypothetical protein [Clostridia bacterium]
MGWLCRGCNSENGFGDSCCRGCGKTAPAAYIALERLAAAREVKEYTNRLTAPAKPSRWLRIRFGRYVNLLNSAATVLLIITLLASILPYRTQAEEFIASRMTPEYMSKRWKRIQTRVAESLDLTEEKALLLARAQALGDVENSAAEMTVNTLLVQRQALGNSGQAAWMRVEGRMESVLMAGMMNSSASNGSMWNGEQNLAGIAQRAETLDFGKWMKEGVRLMIGLLGNTGQER